MTDDEGYLVLRLTAALASVRSVPGTRPVHPQPDPRRSPVLRHCVAAIHRRRRLPPLRWIPSAFISIHSNWTRSTRACCATGSPLPVAPTPFALLCALVRQGGSLITKGALLDVVWGHRYVSDSVLKTAISELRTALGDDARRPRYIETVSGEAIDSSAVRARLRMRNRPWRGNRRRLRRTSLVVPMRWRACIARGISRWPASG